MARTILVADDSPTIQKKAQGILKGEGFEVETVSNGVAAIKKLPKIQPLVVLADVSMPGRDGYEVCDFIKNSPEFGHVPVLLVASDLEPYDEQRGARVRADGIIKKPFDSSELISIVTRFAARAATAAPMPETPVADAAISPPDSAVETPPFDEVQDIGRRQQPQDFSSLPQGIAFAESGFEEFAEPPTQQAKEETVIAAPDPAVVEPTPEQMLSPEPAAETGFAPAEAASEAAVPAFEPPSDPVEPVLIEQPTYVAEPKIQADAVPPAAESETVAPASADSSSVEPVFIEESVNMLEPTVELSNASAGPASEALPPAAQEVQTFTEPALGVDADLTTPHAPLAPSIEDTEIVTEPAQDAELLVSDDSISSVAPVEPQAPVDWESQPAPAASLESFSVAEALTEQKTTVPPQPDVVPPAEFPVAASLAPPAEIPPPIDATLVHSIVHKVVVKMAPPALSPLVVEEMASKLAHEIVTELASGLASTE